MEWMLILVLATLFAAVATILFWAAAFAIAMAIGAFILVVLKFAWWVITRPVVWPIQAIGWMFRDGPKASLDGAPLQPATGYVAHDIHDRTERLSRLKALLDDGALNQAEFDRMADGAHRRQLSALRRRVQDHRQFVQAAFGAGLGAQARNAVGGLAGYFRGKESAGFLIFAANQSEGAAQKSHYRPKVPLTPSPSANPLKKHRCDTLLDRTSPKISTGNHPAIFA
jgi:hypothetical protein